MNTSSSAHRHELGQPYRVAALRPGTIVVREANHTAKSIVTGSPCCRRIVLLDVDDLVWRETQRAKGFPLLDHENRRCPGCRTRYRLRVPHQGNPAGLHFAAVVEWEVRP
jgi:hypothetical protein